MIHSFEKSSIDDGISAIQADPFHERGRILPYDDLLKMIKNLKRSAIDSYMYWNGFEVHESYYIHTNKGSFLPYQSDTKERVTRPGADGEHGGEWKLEGSSLGAKPEYKDVNFVQKFSDIRSRIDEAINPFIGLPDPNSLADLIEKCRRTCRDLSCQASAEGAVSGGGDIADQIRLIHGNLTSMSGAAIAQFKASFLGKMATVVSGMHAVATFVGSTLAAEQKILQGARDAVLETVQKSTESFETSVHSKAGEAKIILNIASWALQGFTLFVEGGGPVGVGLALADLGLTVATDLVDASKEETTIAGGGYDSIMSGFEQALVDINDQIKAGEKTVEKNISDNLERIRVDKSSYDLTVDPVESNEQVVIIQKDLAEEVTKVYMPQIYADLDDTGSIVLKTGMPVKRNETIGIGTDGPSPKFYELAWLLFELISNLSCEVDTGGANLQAAIDDFTRTDDENKVDLDKTLDDIAGKLKGDIPFDPWN